MANNKQDNIIKINGEIIASGEFNSEYVIKLIINGHYICLPADFECLRLAGSLIKKPVIITITEDKSTNPTKQKEEINNKIQEWDLGHE